MGDPPGMEMKRTVGEGTLGVTPAWKPSCGCQPTDSRLGVINNELRAQTKPGKARLNSLSAKMHSWDLGQVQPL